MFPGGDSEMLERIEITGFEVVPTTDGSGSSTVVTQYRINRVPTAATGPSSSAGISNTLSENTFSANVLTQTVTAITE